MCFHFREGWVSKVRSTTFVIRPLCQIIFKVSKLELSDLHMEVDPTHKHLPPLHNNRNKSENTRISKLPRLPPKEAPKLEIWGSSHLARHVDVVLVWRERWSETESHGEIVRDACDSTRIRWGMRNTNHSVGPKIVHNMPKCGCLREFTLRVDTKTKSPKCTHSSPSPLLGPKRTNRKRSHKCARKRFALYSQMKAGVRVSRRCHVWGWYHSSPSLKNIAVNPARTGWQPWRMTESNLHPIKLLQHFDFNSCTCRKPQKHLTRPHRESPGLLKDTGRCLASHPRAFLY